MRLLKVTTLLLLVLGSTVVWAGEPQTIHVGEIEIEGSVRLPMVMSVDSDQAVRDQARALSLQKKRQIEERLVKFESGSPGSEEKEVTHGRIKR